MGANPITAMNITRTCDRCGAIVPASAPHNLCLRCLFDTAVGPDADTSDAEAPARPSSSRQTTPPPIFGDYELLGEQTLPRPPNPHFHPLPVVSDMR